MKHPYEMGGILFTVAILAGICGGFALNSTDFGQSGSGGTAFDTFEEYYEDIKTNHPSLNSYYDDVHKMQGDCKKNAYDLQDFYDCVNKP